MPEPILHFAIPFFFLMLVGMKPKKAFLASLFAFAPDIDALLLVHRSPTHSLLVIAAIVAIFLVFVRRRPAFNFGLIIAGVLFSHIVLDMFQTYTPVLWPLYDRSIWLKAEFDLGIGSYPRFNFNLQLLQAPTEFRSNFNLFNVPLNYVYTNEGLGLSLAILAFAVVLYKITRRKHPPSGGRS